MPPENHSDPASSYRAALDDGLLMPDQMQAEIVEKLQTLFVSVTTGPVARKEKTTGFFSRLFRQEEKVALAQVNTGLYIWGGVGRGKTLLCDMFFETLPIAKKKRIHFHRFMQGVHDKLREISNAQSPLEIVAEDYAQKFRVLVLDEMHINDITDAMLMSGLLQGLFNRGVVIVTTSNVHPDDLYRDGLQRAQFLPAIEALKSHTDVVYLGGDTDYRLRALENAEIYHTPLDEASENVLNSYFRQAVASASFRCDTTVDINSREIEVYRVSETVAWFRFDALCETNRSTDDYIELAKRFDTVLISDIPEMDVNNTDSARRFINLVDEFYDRKVKLVVTAAKLPEALYSGSKLSFEFERTASRLREMQSKEYLAVKHQQ